jgi:glutaminyl-peptide cyclotransferase
MKLRSLSFPRTRPALVLAYVTLGLMALLSGCPQQDSQAAVSQRPADTAVLAKATPVAEAAAKPEYTRYFDADRAWKHLHNQLGFGYRVPNTPGHRTCRKYLEQELLVTCDKVEKQEFTVPVGGKNLEMVNLIGRIGLDKPRRIILAAHWDTRPTADFNPRGSRNQPIAGANDGASGVAVVLELARVFKENPPAVGIDYILFDGEDYGPGIDMMFLGAKHFAKKLSGAQVAQYNYGILLDMIGDRNLDIHPESNSENVAPLLFTTAQAISEDLGFRCFKTQGGYEIMDDHLALIARGIKMYDFIDFTYPYWHTTEDTEDKCSAESLEAVGLTVENMIYLFPAIYGEKL